jgi:hypothetical protein
MGLIENARELASLIKAAGDTELYRRIVDLQGELVSLSSRNFELETKCRELEAAVELRKNLRHHRQLYVLEGDPVPFCPRCFENNGKLIHLFGPHRNPAPHEYDLWACHICHHDYSAAPGSPFQPNLNFIRLSDEKRR